MSPTYRLLFALVVGGLYGAAALLVVDMCIEVLA